MEVLENELDHSSLLNQVKFFSRVKEIKVFSEVNWLRREKNAQLRPASDIFNGYFEL